MKKSIIIISLLIISSTQSCDRSDESLSSENLLKSTKKDLNLQSPDIPLSAKDQDEQSIDPNNDEEPRRDKQHWRVPQDSTR